MERFVIEQPEAMLGQNAFEHDFHLIDREGGADAATSTTKGEIFAGRVGAIKEAVGSNTAWIGSG
jgi:hypothetical protein